MSNNNIASSSSLVGTNMPGESYRCAFSAEAVAGFSVRRLIGVYVDEHTPLSKTSASCRANVCETEREREHIFGYQQHGTTFFHA